MHEAQPSNETITVSEQLQINEITVNGVEKQLPPIIQWLRRVDDNFIIGCTYFSSYSSPLQIGHLFELVQIE